MVYCASAVSSDVVWCLILFFHFWLCFHQNEIFFFRFLRLFFSNFSFFREKWGFWPFWKQFCKNCFDGSFLVATVVTYSEFYFHLYTIVNIYRVFEIIFCWNFYSSYGFGFIILVEAIKMIVSILDLGVFRLVVSSFSIHGLFISSFWVRPFYLELIF